MDKTFEIMSELNKTARQHGVKNIDVSIGKRRNKRGSYDYITMTFVVGGKETLSEAQEAPEETSHEEIINNNTIEPETGSENEVNNNEIQ